MHSKFKKFISVRKMWCGPMAPSDNCIWKNNKKIKITIKVLKLINILDLVGLTFCLQIELLLQYYGISISILFNESI